MLVKFKEIVNTLFWGGTFTHNHVTAILLCIHELRGVEGEIVVINGFCQCHLYIYMHIRNMPDKHVGGIL